MATSITGISLDELFKNSPIGSIDRAIGNNAYGINHMQTLPAALSNRDTYGFTFFVRPQLNMQPDNLRNLRLFSSLLTSESLSVQRFIRTTLDPRLMAGYKFRNHSVPRIDSPLTDNLNAFIPLLTNNLISLSGWPDLVAPTYDSKPGIYQEEHSMVDGIVKIYSGFELNATFTNTRCHSILFMFYVWLHYAANVFEGLLQPYLDFITENEIDYNTRIYRIVLDQYKQKVVKIAATGVAIPLNLPMGSYFDYNTDSVYNTQNKEVSIRFKCLGACYNDDILVYEFNKTVEVFNPGMSDRMRDATMIMLTPIERRMFNNKGYPRINPFTMDLEWWVDNSTYQQLLR